MPRAEFPALRFCAQWMLPILLFAQISCVWAELRLPPEVAVLDVVEIDGTVWLATSDGAYRVERDTLRRVPDQPLTVWTIRKAGGAVWLLSTCGAYRVEGDRAVRIPDRILDVMDVVEVRGETWLRTQEGAFRLKRDEALLVSSEKDSYPTVRDAGGITWVEDLCHLYRVKGDIIQSFEGAFGLMGWVDPRTDSAWLQSGDGATEIVDGAVHCRVLKGKKVHCIRHAAGSTWIATSDGVYRLCGKKMTQVFQSNEDMDFHYMVSDGGAMWVASGSEDRIYRIEGNRVKRFDDVNASRLADIERTEGTMWLVPYLGDVYRFTKGRLAKTDYSFVPLFKKKQGQVVWIGSENGLYRLEGDKIEQVMEDWDLNSLEFHGEEVWCASDQGAYRIRDGVVQKMTDESTEIVKVVPAGGRMWVLTSWGDVLVGDGESLVPLRGNNSNSGQWETEVGDGLCRIRGHVVDVRLVENNKTSILFDVTLDLQFYNSGNCVAWLWNSPQPYSDDSRLWFVSYSVARNISEASNMIFLGQDWAGPSNYRSPEWTQLRCALDRALPPEDRLQKLAPEETMPFQVTIRVSVPKLNRPFSHWTDIWPNLDLSVPLGLRVTAEVWPINLEYAAPINQNRFGQMLRRRWLPYGVLQLGNLTSEPIPLDLSAFRGLQEKNHKTEEVPAD